MTSRALKFAAACAVLSAITTFLLWLLPRLETPAAGFEAGIGRHSDAIYLGRLWVNFTHVFLAWISYAATAWLLRTRSLALSVGGLAAFSVWSFTEALGVIVNIFAVNATWRAGYAAATADAQRELRTHLAAFPAVWDAMFFLLLVGFLLGTLCYGFAAVRGRGLERVVGWLFLAAAPLTLAIMLGGYTRFTALEPVVDLVYPALQPVSRILLGVWLWRSANDLPR